MAFADIRKGASKDRKYVLHGARKKKKKKIVWVTTYDPRLPLKPSIIQKKSIHLLYQNEENKNIFEKRMIIRADRRRKNLADI